MRTVICVHERFDATWPFAGDYWRDRWPEAEFHRTEEAGARVTDFVEDPAAVRRLVLLGFPFGEDDLAPFERLEALYLDPIRDESVDGIDAAEKRGVTVVRPRGDIQWGQSVAEFALGLTIGALRRIPQTYRAMLESHEVWKYSPKVGKPNQRGAQFGDDPDFANGTIAGKRVRVVGVGNIGGRYAAWCAAMGADVAVWDPFAPEASFSLAGVRRRFEAADLVKDAEIFAPMVPLKEDTRGLVPAAQIDDLPRGALVVLVTRAGIVDTEALYKRVLNDEELSLAADVWDAEPVPLDSPLLGRHNVVHTPHNAGRTIHANHARVDDAIGRFPA